MRSSSPISRPAAVAFVAALALGACAGDDEGGGVEPSSDAAAVDIELDDDAGQSGSEPDAVASDEPGDADAVEAVEDAADLVEQAESGGLGTGTATVSIDDSTFEYRAFDGRAAVCVDRFGTLQVNLYLVDPATGDVLDGPQLAVVIPQRDDGAPADLAPPFVEFTTPDGTDWAAGSAGIAEIYGVETPPVDWAADGLTASATVTVVDVLGDGRSTDATIDIRCA